MTKLYTYRILLERYANIRVKAKNKEESIKIARELLNKNQFTLEEKPTRWEIIDSYNIDYQGEYHEKI